MIKKFSVPVSGLLLAGCASGYQPVHFYNEILIVNNSRQLVRDVAVNVSGTGRVFSCGNIAPHGICSNRFGKRRYEAKPIRIGWVFGNVARQSESFVVEVPVSFTTGVAMRGVLDFKPDGSVSAFFQQDSLFR